MNLSEEKESMYDLNITT